MKRNSGVIFERFKCHIGAYCSMEVLKLAPMEFYSSESVMVFLLLGNFKGVVVWMAGLVWLKCCFCMEMQFLRPGEVTVSAGVLVTCRIYSKRRAFARQDICYEM